MGYGIDAPEYGWDDYKGADLHGKVLLMMNNDPATTPRCSPARRGSTTAAGTTSTRRRARTARRAPSSSTPTPSAGYPLQVVQTSWTGEELGLPEADEPHARGAGLGDRGRRPAGSPRSAARTSTRCVPRPRRRDFQPVPLGVTLGIVAVNAGRQARRKPPTSSGGCPGATPRCSRRGRRLHGAPRPPRQMPGAAEASNGSTTARSTTPRVRRAAGDRARPSPRCRAAAPIDPVRGRGGEEQGLLGSLYLARHPPVAPDASPRSSTSTASTSGAARAT